jgi:hypothetical protein
MGNIPNTNTANLVLQSVGNGSNDSRWGTSSGSGTNATQLQSKDISTTAPSNAQILVWNSSTSKWTPVSVSQDVTITNAGVATVAGINGYLVPNTGAQQGNILYYNSTSGKWEYGGAESTGATPAVGDVLVWSSTTGWTAGPVSSTPSLLGNPTGSMFQNSSTNVTNTIALVQNMASNFVNGSVTFNGSGGSYPYSLRVPTTGYYQVDGQVYIAAGTATGGYVISLIYVNGSEVMRANSYGTGGAAPHCGGVIALNANDYVQLYAQVQSGSAATSVVAGSLRTFVSLSLVSQ